MPKSKDPNAIPNGIYVTMPPDLYRAVKAAATKANTPEVATFLRNKLAREYNVTLPEAKSRQIVAGKSAADLKKELLAAFKKQLLAAEAGTDVSALIAKVAADAAKSS